MNPFSIGSKTENKSSLLSSQEFQFFFPVASS